ncbi:MAG: protein kinase, partial [Ilumatobacteraceae bacterium]
MSADRPAERSGTRRGLAGRVLGDRYRIVRVTSAGANTLIADAEDLELDRPVTVKLIRPEWAESAPFRKRFVAQMRGMSSLSHPNIAAVHDWGEEQIGKRTTVYAVVEYLPGGSLRDLFDRGRYLDPSQALVIGLEACRGLDFAHRKGLVHTELTPAKMVFGDDRRLRIVDFALARMLGEHDWAEPATVATHVARYSSPEQALAQPIDGKTDVYSLALILVEAVTGSVPFSARSTVATLSARIGRLMPVSADLGPLASVLERAGRPEPADRYTASEFGRALVRAAEKLPRPTPIPLLVVSPFEDDPSQMRRPNDPTGGIDRPPVDEPAVALVPAVAPVVEPDPAVPGDAPVAEPETAAAPAPEAVEATTTEPAPTALPAPTIDEAAARRATDEPTVVGAVAVAGSAPSLYDGDADRTKDELAALARPADVAVVDEAVTSSPIDTVVAAPPPDAPVVGPPAPDGSPSAGWSGPLETMDGGRRRRRWVPWAVAVVLVGALAALGFVAYSLFRTPTHEVPELVGLDEAAARAQTADFDWDLEFEQDRSDEHPDVGEIIRTAPSAGERLGEGEPFLVVVSEGPELRTLPDLT